MLVLVCLIFVSLFFNSENLLGLSVSMWAYVLIPLLFPYILLTIKVSLYIVKPLSFLLRLSSSFLSTIKFSPIGKTTFFSLM